MPKCSITIRLSGQITQSLFSNLFSDMNSVLFLPDEYALLVDMKKYTKFVSINTTVFFLRCYLRRDEFVTLGGLFRNCGRYSVVWVTHSLSCVVLQLLMKIVECYFCPQEI